MRTPLTTGIAIHRIALGAVFLAHGLVKILGVGLPGTAAYFESVGFPGFTAYLVAPAEVAAGIALILGFQTRAAAISMIPILLGAIVVHFGNGWMFSSPKGGWEFPAYLVVSSFVQVLFGNGAFSIDGQDTRNLPSLNSGRRNGDGLKTAS